MVARVVVGGDDSDPADKIDGVVSTTSGYSGGNVDPVDSGGQFCDRGNQYRTGIFYHNEDQRRAAEQSKADLNRSGKLPKEIVTEIMPMTAFYAAEEYHQDYYLKNPLRYKYYRTACGRDRRLDQLWGEH